MRALIRAKKLQNRSPPSTLLGGERLPALFDGLYVVTTSEWAGQLRNSFAYLLTTPRLQISDAHDTAWAALERLPDLARATFGAADRGFVLLGNVA